MDFGLLFRSWWFWLIVVIVIFVLFFPLVPCGVVAYGDNGLPSGSITNHIPLLFYLLRGGCPV